MLLQELLEMEDDGSDRKIADVPTEDELDNDPRRPRRKIKRSKADPFKKDDKKEDE